MRSLVLALMMVVLLTPSARAVEGINSPDKILPIGAGGKGAFLFVKDDNNLGFVGINTDNPTYNLHVIGTTNISGTLTVNELRVSGTGSFDAVMPDPFIVKNLMVSDTATIGKLVITGNAFINASVRHGAGLTVGDTLYAKNVVVTDNADPNGATINADLVEASGTLSANVLRATTMLSAPQIIKHVSDWKGTGDTRPITALDFKGCNGKYPVWHKTSASDGYVTCN